jgi:hypothetical protein
MAVGAGSAGQGVETWSTFGGETLMDADVFVCDRALVRR